MKVTIITETERKDGITCQIDVTSAPNDEKNLTINFPQPRQIISIYLNRVQCSQLAGLLESSDNAR